MRDFDEEKRDLAFEVAEIRLALSWINGYAVAMNARRLEDHGSEIEEHLEKIVGLVDVMTTDEEPPPTEPPQDKPMDSLNAAAATKITPPRK